MALFAALSDGITTVYMRRCVAGDDLVGRPDGYKQKLARRRSDGGYEEVTETWELVFTSSSDVDRGAVLVSLGKLSNKAWERKAHKQLDNWVWLQVQTPTESGGRYALVSDIFVPELDGRHYRSNALPDLRIEVTREGAWRPTAPNAAWAGKRTDDDTWALWNKEELGVVTNYDVIDAATLGGDAAALVRFGIVPDSWAPDSSEVVRHVLAIKSNADFHSHFNAVDSDASGLLVTDANSPGGQRIQRAFAGGDLETEIYWDIWPGSTTIADYEGDYLLYAVVEPTPYISMQLIDSNGHELTELVSLDVSLATSDYAALFMGRVSLLPGANDIIPNETLDDYYLGIHVVASQADTFNFRNLIFIPIDEGVVSVAQGRGNGRIVYFDGDARRVYVVNSGGGNPQAIDMDLQMSGDWFGIPQGRDVAVHYFCFSRHYSQSQEFYRSGRAVDLTIEMMERFMSLRN